MGGFLMIPREHVEVLIHHSIGAESIALYTLLLHLSSFDENGVPTQAEVKMSDIARFYKEKNPWRKVRKILTDLAEVGIVEWEERRKWKEKHIVVLFTGIQAWSGAKTAVSDRSVIGQRVVSDRSVIGQRAVSDAETSVPHEHCHGDAGKKWIVSDRSVIGQRVVSDRSVIGQRAVIPSLYIETRDIETGDRRLLYKEQLANASSENATEATSTDDKRDTKRTKRRDDVPYTEIIAAWNEMARDTGLSMVQKLTEQRKRAIRARWQDEGGDKDQESALQAFRDVFRRVSESDFLTGRKDGSSWRADFDWVLKPDHWVRIQEGRYDNRPTPISRNRKEQRMPRAFESLFELLEDAKAGRVGGSIFDA